MGKPRKGALDTAVQVREEDNALYAISFSDEDCQRRRDLFLSLFFSAFGLGVWVGLGWFGFYDTPSVLKIRAAILTKKIMKLFGTITKKSFLRRRKCFYAIAWTACRMTEVLLDDDNAFYAIVGRPRGSFSGYYEDRIGGGGLVARFFLRGGGG